MSTRTLTAQPILNPSVFDDFFKPWNNWFGRDFPTKMQTIPAVNVKEDPDKYMISLAAPGMKKEDFVVDINNNMLTIKSEKEEKKESVEEQFTRKEYSFTSFERSFMMPDDVVDEEISAQYQDGILHVKLPRKISVDRQEAARKIDVK